MSVTGI